MYLYKLESIVRKLFTSQWYLGVIFFTMQSVLFPFRARYGAGNGAIFSICQLRQQPHLPKNKR